MADKGTITGKDLITDEGVNRPLEYEMNLLKVLDTTKELVKVALQYNKLSNQVKVSKTEKEYLQIKKQGVQVDKESARVQKELYQAELALQKTRTETERTRKAKLEADRKQNLITKQGTKLTIKERIENQAKNKVLRMQARLQLGLVGAYEKLNLRRNQAQRTLQNLLAAEKRNNKEIEKARRNFNLLDKQVKAVDKASNTYTKNIGNYKSGFDALNGVVRSLITSLGVVGGFSLAVEVVKNAYRQAKQLDVLNKSLKAVVKTEQEFGEAKGFLSKIADDYGLKLDGLTKSYIRFIAASKGTNLEGQKSIDIFDKVNKASAILGLSADENTGILRALEQMMSKGKVQAEELRGQLGDRLPGAFNIMARAMGVSTSELDKMLKNGEVMADEVLPKFAVELEKTFGADKTKRIDNMVSAENRFNNAWLELIEGIEKGEGSIGKAVMSIVNMGTALVKFITPAKDVTESIKKQQLELNTLRFKIINVNTANEDRVRLINKLKTDYPGLLGNIDAEKVSNEDLETALKKVNQQLVARIVLAKKQQEIDEQAEVTAEKFLKVKEEEDRFENAIAEGAKRAVDFKVDGAKNDKENAKALISYLEANEKYTNQYDGIIREINQSMITLKHNSNILNTEQQKGYDLEKQKRILAKELGLITDDNTKKKEDEVKVNKRNIEFLNNLIAKEKQKLGLAESREGAKVIQERIELLKKELDSILGTGKASDKVTEKQIETFNSLFELNKFRKQEEIKAANEIASNENENFIDREEALISRVEREIELEDILLSNKKLKLEEEKTRRISEGTASVEFLQSINDRKALAQEEYYSKIGEINAKFNTDGEQLSSSNSSSEFNIKLRALEKQSNDEITILNKAFLEKEISHEEHEKKVLAIKAKYSKDALELQISSIDQLLKSSELSADKRAKYELKLSKLKRELSDLDTNVLNGNNKERLENEQKLADAIKDLTNELKASLQDIGNSIFEHRIINIDREIDKSQEKYDRQIELAEGDAVQQDLIRREAEKERQKLEKKKQKEQRRQAIFNKALALGDIAIHTASAITEALPNIPLSLVVGGIGALQTATVLAQPIPAYAEGTDYHEGGYALVGEVRPEVIQEPNKDPYIITGPSILDLPKGTSVIPSVEEYNRMFQNEYFRSLNADVKRAQEFQTINQVYNFDSKAIENAIAEGFKKQKVHFHTTNNTNVDIGDVLWRDQQIKW